jgi:hypothetical protein
MIAAFGFVDEPVPGSLAIRMPQYVADIAPNKIMSPVRVGMVAARPDHWNNS